MNVDKQVEYYVNFRIEWNECWQASQLIIGCALDRILVHQIQKDNIYGQSLFVL